MPFVVIPLSPNVNCLVFDFRFDVTSFTFANCGCTREANSGTAPVVVMIAPGGA